MFVLGKLSGFLNNLVTHIIYRKVYCFVLFFKFKLGMPLVFWRAVPAPGMALSMHGLRAQSCPCHLMYSVRGSSTGQLGVP